MFQTKRFLYLNVLLVALALATSTVFFLQQVRESAEQWVLREQDQHLRTFKKLLASKGHGFTVQNGQLLVGNYVLNGRNELPDTVSEIFGGTATIFLGDRRIATNALKQDGSRAIGTVLQGPPRIALFNHGTSYRGEALVLGVPSLTAYDPIKNADGNIIGALYVGTPKSTYMAVYDKFRSEIALFAVVLTILFSSAAFLLVRLSTRNERQLAEKEQKFSQLFEMQSDAVVLVNTETDAIVEANHSACSLYGFTRDALVGQKITVLGNIDVAAAPNLAHAIRHRARDGRAFPVECRVSHLTLREDTVAIVAIRDVTEREQAAEELRENRERLVFAAELASLVQWEYDVASGLFRFNDEFYALYGTTAEREGGYSLSCEQYMRFLPSECAGMVPAGIERALASRNCDYMVQVEHPILRRDGETRYMVVRFRVACNDAGNIIKLYGTNQDITDLKKAELAAREGYQLFRAAFDVIPEYLSISGFEDGVFTDVNPGFTKVTGYAAEDVIGKSALQLGIWTNEGDRRRLIETVQKEGFADSLVTTFRHKDGHYLTVAVSAGKITLHNKSFLFGFVKDITESRRAENAMVHLNRTLRALTKCNEALVRASNEQQLLNDICRLVVEEGGHRLAWVAYAEKDAPRAFRAVAEAGDTGGYVQTLQITWDDADIEQGPVGTAIRTGAPAYVADIELAPPTAGWRQRAESHGFRSILAVPLLSEVQHGAISIYSAEPDAFDPEEVELMMQLANDLAYGIGALRTRASHREATETLRSAAEEYRALAASSDQQRALLRALLDSIPDLIFFKDHSSTYLGCNKAFATFAGRTEQELTGMTDFDIFPREAAALFREMDNQMMTQRQTLRYEEWVNYPDGRRVLLETLKTPFYDPDGTACGLIGISRDVTERHHAEEKRGQLEVQLHQAQKMEAVGQLAGGIAHDFNNILTAIMGYSDILAIRLEEDSVLRGYASQVQLATGRAAELTARLLAFSRKQVLRTKPVVLQQAVSEFKKVFARIIPEDIDFTVNMPKEDLVVLADQGQLEQVLMNLLTNAKDAMPQGGTLVLAGSKVSMDTGFLHVHGFGALGDYACLSVSDTGVGMDEETKRRIFEPFYTTKALGKGTGLGMAVTYGIVKQHNGYIAVQSALHAGTTCQIYLPLLEEVPQHAEVSAEEYPVQGGKETILLAEDDEAVRQLHKMILEQAGYRVIEAGDGQDALEHFIAHEGEIDFLATDVVMPKLDGKALYEKIKNLHPGIKAIFMSGYTKDVVIMRGVVPGEVPLLHKPFPPAELLKKVRSILDQPTELNEK
ncbi:PAS domain S-box protein [Geomonas sp. RF6]|uniref:PAS domain S-box protein n=1 Tax=Geomonas sp. RF6 TaxID=2897342 RepID=UPI001E50C08C|nr:PAS domain S-box protein [Geomonas sp. RF6]UFS72663.1 PAS domain S-box protein [Geomonas sp. RF6]